MSDITVINDSEQSSLVTNGLAKNGELYLKAAGSTDAGAIVVYDSGSWRTFANEYAPSFSNTYSVSLDGTNDILTLDSTASFSGEFTFSTWVNLSSLQGIRLWFGAVSGGTTLMFYLTNKVYFRTAQGVTTLEQGVSWNTGEWHHVMVTRNSSNLITMFIDGSSVTTGTNSDTLTLNTFGDTSYPFSGLIDEYAVWGSDQSSNISAIYNSGVPSDLTSYSPLGWWRMGENDGGTGTTITDQGVTYDPAANGGAGGYVASGNDASFQNGPTFSTTVPS